jgi:hypothetical protein
MAARRLDEDIDRLYQLPLDQFTTARNALAKQAGADGAQIRDLEKPSVAAWAVNQLYWHRRPAYDALMQAAEALRAAHKAVLGGRAADLREAGQAHEKQIDQATKATLAALADQGQPVTDATKQAIVTSLRALPVEGPPGRLTRPLQPGGFEMLQGLSLAPGAAVKSRTTAVPQHAATTAKTKTGKAPVKPVNTKALLRAREAAASAARVFREAEHTAKRVEFDLARAAREADKAAKELTAARATLERAQHDVEEAEAAATEASRVRDTAEHRAKQAEAALDAARTRVAAAEAQVQSLEQR